MPLSSALISKLYKRGIINQNTIKQLNSNNVEKQARTAFIFCPNTYNIHHGCSTYCQTRWKGFATPEPRYVKNMKIALGKYPLPPKWQQVFDRGIGRYYYWNTGSDVVSWLPPGHPNAQIGESADKMRRQKKHTYPMDEQPNRDKHTANWSGRDRSQRGLDPMDPSAYSDVPRGCWRDGLEQNRGLADNTASGALFQQRPYSSPGAVLALNKRNQTR